MFKLFESHEKRMQRLMQRDALLTEDAQKLYAFIKKNAKKDGWDNGRYNLYTASFSGKPEYKRLFNNPDVQNKLKSLKLCTLDKPYGYGVVYVYYDCRDTGIDYIMI